MQRNKFILSTLLLLAAFCVGRFSTPRSIETKEVEKIVYKDKVKKDEQKSIRLETRETILPDGTRIRETIRQKETDTHTDTSREMESATEKTSKTHNQAQWSLGVYTNREFIAGTIDRRIFGGVLFGIHIQSTVHSIQPQFGLGVRLEF